MREERQARRRDLTIEIEAVERAIENAYFVAEVVALEAVLAELQRELEELWDTTPDTD